MLEALEQVDWTRLRHAYGAAQDTPAAIRDLRAPDAGARQKAINRLLNTIFHQGSRYSASAPAVPFLCEVLEAPDTPDRAEILLLLEYLAVGYPEPLLQRGFDPEKAFARATRLARRVDLAAVRAAELQEQDKWDIAVDNLWKKDAYEAVLARIDLLQRLTHDAESVVRIEAVRALAWFPAAAAGSILRVREIARDSPDPGERANAIHCLALLGRYLQDRSDVAWLRTQLAPEHPYIVRVTAAFSLAILSRRRLSADAIDILLDTVQHPKKAQAAGAGVSWHWLGLLSEVVQVLRRVRPEPTEAVLAALCQAAERVEDSMAGVDVFYALLAVTFPRPRQLALERDSRGFPYLDPSRLTPIQWRALEAIGRSPVWRKEPFFYGRLMDLGLEYGLPWHPEPFARYLSGKADPAAGSE